MATVKIVLRNKPNLAGLYPLAIRITQHRKSTYIHLGQHIRDEDWDGSKVKGSHPSAKRLNAFLLKKLTEATDKALELEGQDKSVKAIRHAVKPLHGAMLFAHATAYLDSLKATGKYNRYMAERTNFKRVEKYTHDVALTDITIGWLKHFEAHMTQSVKPRTAMNTLHLLRNIFSLAIKAGAVDQKFYPFGKDGFKLNRPSPIKIGLSREEIALLENTAWENPRDKHVVDLWLFSYYTAGMRVSDVLRLKWADIEGGRLSYVMGKNNKPGSLKLHPKALAILERYPQDHAYIFPELRVASTKRFDMQRTIMHKVIKINARLQNRVAPAIGLTKELTMHRARHSFAQEPPTRYRCRCCKNCIGIAASKRRLVT